MRGIGQRERAPLHVAAHEEAHAAVVLDCQPEGVARATGVDVTREAGCDGTVRDLADPKGTRLRMTRCDAGSKREGRRAAPGLVRRAATLCHGAQLTWRPD